MDGTDRRVLAAHIRLFDHAGSGMIGLAGFDRSLTRYRNNSTDIAGTASSRLISIFLFFKGAGGDIDDWLFFVLFCRGINPPASPTRARFSQPIFSEILGSRSIRQ